MYDNVAAVVRLTKDDMQVDNPKLLISKTNSTLVFQGQTILIRRRERSTRNPRFGYTSDA